MCSCRQEVDRHNGVREGEEHLVVRHHEHYEVKDHESRRLFLVHPSNESGHSWDWFPVVLLRQPRARPYFERFEIRPGFNHDWIEVPLTDRRAWWNILSWGVYLVDVHNKERIEWSASDRVSSQWVRGSCLDCSEHCIAFHIVPLNFTHCPFPLGLKLVVRLVATPCECNQDFSSWDWKDDHRSEWMYEHIPKIEQLRQTLNEQGKAKGNLEYSSTTVRKYLLLEALGNGPLKFKFSRSKTCVALISRASFERTKWGFICWHSSHWEVISRMSVRENGRFLVRTKWPICVTPGWQSNGKIAQAVLLNITTVSSTSAPIATSRFCRFWFCWRVARLTWMTLFWSVTRVKCFPISKCLHFLSASTTA